MPLWRGDEDAFLYVGNERAVFFLGALALRDVFQHMNSAESASTGIRESGVGGKKESWKPRIGFVTFPCPPFTIRTIFKTKTFLWEQIANAAARVGRRFPPGQMAQPLIQSNDAKLLVVHKDRIADRIERVLPLPVNAVHLFKQPDVLQRKAQ